MNPEPLRQACLGLMAHVVLAGAAAETACAQTPPPQEGLAAHYGAKFIGRKTASGEPYRPERLTAAHKTLPLGTVVKVTRIDDEGQRKAGPVKVRINDRGPYGKAIIDLSAAAARRLRMFGGVARVRVEVVRLPKPKVRPRMRGS